MSPPSRPVLPRALRPPRRCGRATARVGLVVVAILAMAGWALPVATDLFVFVGDSAELRLAPGAVDTVPVVANLRSVSDNVASLNLRVTWDPSVLTVDSVFPGAFGTVTLNEDDLASGELRASIFNATGDTLGFDALQLVLRAGATEALAHVNVEVLTAGSELGEDMTDLVATRNLAVCVGVDGVLGEVTGDGSTDVLDAQQIARWALGLSVSGEVSQAVAAGLGDGNEDGATNVVDAQQVARHAAGGPVVGRVGQAVQGSCAGAAPEVRYTDVAAGMNHACALSEAGDVFCWGSNNQGQLGVGTTDATLAPVRALMPVAAVEIDAASRTTCALGADGAAYCWGQNSLGQAGIGAAGDDALTPTAVAGGLTFGAIEVGERSSCGLTDAGAVHCWGVNSNDLLPGVGTACNPPSTELCTAAPVAIFPSSVFQELSVALGHACGILGDGSPVCWGWSDFGQLGIGPPTSSSVDTLVTVSGGLAFQELVAGTVHSCGITGAGRTYCWGTDYAGQGQLGLGGASPTVPTELAGTSFRELALSAENSILQHTCALDEGGRAWCWGLDIQGAVGSGVATSTCSVASYTADCYLTPVRVDGGLGFRDLTLGGNFTCGVTNGGRVFCWGANDTGQLGDGTTTDRLAPVATLRPGLGLTVEGVSGPDPEPGVPGGE